MVKTYTCNCNMFSVQCTNFSIQQTCNSVDDLRIIHHLMAEIVIEFHDCTMIYKAMIQLNGMNTCLKKKKKRKKMEKLLLYSYNNILYSP